ncbi:hypothetical protein K474DRAFT_1680936, partial [Panus rudis PR-1116 ss-1]
MCADGGILMDAKDHITSVKRSWIVLSQQVFSQLPYKVHIYWKKLHEAVSVDIGDEANFIGEQWKHGPSSVINGSGENTIQSADPSTSSTSEQVVYPSSQAYPTRKKTFESFVNGIFKKYARMIPSIAVKGVFTDLPPGLNPTLKSNKIIRPTRSDKEPSSVANSAGTLHPRLPQSSKRQNQRSTVPIPVFTQHERLLSKSSKNAYLHINAALQEVCAEDCDRLGTTTLAEDGAELEQEEQDDGQEWEGQEEQEEEEVEISMEQNDGNPSSSRTGDGQCQDNNVNDDNDESPFNGRNTLANIEDDVDDDSDKSVDEELLDMIGASKLRSQPTHSGVPTVIVRDTSEVEEKYRKYLDKVFSLAELEALQFAINSAMNTSAELDDASTALLQTLDQLQLDTSRDLITERMICNVPSYTSAIKVIEAQSDSQTVLLCLTRRRILMAIGQVHNLIFGRCLPRARQIVKLHTQCIRSGDPTSCHCASYGEYKNEHWVNRIILALMLKLDTRVDFILDSSTYLPSIQPSRTFQYTRPLNNRQIQVTENQVVTNFKAILQMWLDISQDHCDSHRGLLTNLLHDKLGPHILLL